MIIYVIEGDIGDYYSTRNLLGASNDLQDIYNRMLATLNEHYYQYYIYFFKGGASIGYTEFDNRKIGSYQDFEKTILSEVKCYE